jgi:hypothetical protein
MPVATVRLGGLQIRDVKIYLDTNIVSRLTDLRVSDATAAAYASLAETQDLTFVTSEKSRQEVRRTTNATKNAVLQLLVSFLDKVASQTVY